MPPRLILKEPGNPREDSKEVRTHKSKVALKQAFRHYATKQFRPFKLNLNVIEEVEDYLSRGLPITKCCQLMGISRQCYYLWVRKGQEFLKERKPDKYAINALFVESIDRAVAKWQLHILDRSFQDAYSANWVRDITLLERRDREHWSRSEIVNHKEHTVDPDERFL